MKEAVPQRDYPMWVLFNALRYVIRRGVAWRVGPNDSRLGLRFTGRRSDGWRRNVFEMLAQDPRALLRLAAGRKEEPNDGDTTAARCARSLNAARVPAMVAPSANAGRNCTWRDETPIYVGKVTTVSTTRNGVCTLKLLPQRPGRDLIRPAPENWP